MKILRIISFILMGLGILLFSFGILFKILHWPDMLAGFTSGPIVAVTGVLIFILSLFIKHGKTKT